MDCVRVTLPNGSAAIVCGSGLRPKRCACGSGKRADRLCDWKVAGKKSGTCDAKICEACSHSPAEDKDLCPTHAAEWRARLAALRAMAEHDGVSMAEQVRNGDQWGLESAGVDA